MSRKDYEAIAQAFRKAKAAVKESPTLGNDALVGIAFAEQAISNTLQGDNERFSAERFAQACIL